MSDSCHQHEDGPCACGHAEFVPCFLCPLEDACKDADECLDAVGTGEDEL